MQTSAHRFDVATGARRKFDIQSVALQDAGIWPGVRLEQWNGSGGELPETVLFQHGLMLNLEPMRGSAIKWVGHRGYQGDQTTGTFGIFPAGIPYHGESKGCTSTLVASLSPAFLQSVSGAARAEPVELQPGGGLNDAFVSGALHALANDVREGSPAGGMYGESIGVALAAHLTRKYSAAALLKSQLPSVADQKRARVREFILDRLEQRLSLAELAAFSQLDLYSFARWFKSAFGMPPHQYVLLARVSRAKALLADSNLRLVDLALQCGFSSQSHLANTFRKFVGLSPAVYRKAACNP